MCLSTHVLSSYGPIYPSAYSPIHLFAHLLLYQSTLTFLGTLGMRQCGRARCGGQVVAVVVAKFS